MKGKLIYLFIVTFFFLIIVSLPLVKVPISISSLGSVSDLNEDHPIISTVSGRVIKSFIKKNNQFVKKGDTLLVINKDYLGDFNQFYLKQIDDYIHQIDDLRKLANGNISTVNTDIYKKQVRILLDEETQVKSEVDLAIREFERTKKLFEEGISSKAHYEKAYFTLENLKSKLKIIRENYISKWQIEKRDIERLLRDTRKEFDLNKKNMENYIIKSPIDGVIHDIIYLQPNGYIQENTKLGNIASNNNTIIKARVLPKDIGFIRNGQKIKVQVESFNYNQWGLLDGKVIEIHNNLSLDETTNQYYFNVICSTNKNYLKLKNGYKGHIIKGMSVTIRFYLIDRTLWELIFDNIDDWFNPNKI